MITQGSTVEVYVGKCDQTWETMFITPADDLEPTTENLLSALFAEYSFMREEDIAFIGVYSIEEPGD